MWHFSYSDAVAETQSYITVTIDLEDPIELTEFVGMFASLAKQFDDYLKANHPDLHGEARIYIKDVRHGSIVADLVPMMAILVEFMDKTLIVAQFSQWIAARIATYTQEKWWPGAQKSDIAEITDMVRAVANNKGGQARIETVKYIDGKQQKALEIEFDTKGARKALTTLETHKIELDKRESADRENVLMVFFQANLKETDIGQRHGEQVIIETIDARPKPLAYASDLAKERIKAEFGDAVFKKGFYVDVNVEYLQGRIVAYKVKDVRTVIDIPAD